MTTDSTTPTDNYRDVASHPVGLTPPAVAILEHVTRHRNNADMCGVPRQLLSAVAGVDLGDLHRPIVELQLRNKVEVRCVIDGVIVFRVIPPILRVARRRSYDGD